MRAQFCKSMKEVLARDKSAFFITGDLGYSAFEGIQSEFPDRFLNAGVAEQNMVGAAAGMAYLGLTPWVYSIAPFLVFRAFEQIRNDVCFHNLPVRLVGNGGGYTYGMNGSTHHALEDLGVLKGLPNMELFFPCTDQQVEPAIRHLQSLPGPGYLRLSISPWKTSVAPLGGNARTLTCHFHQGDQITVVGMGHAVHTALSALEKGEIGSGVADIFGVARFPFDMGADQDLAASISRTGNLLVIEEHYQVGGLGESFRQCAPEARSFGIMAARYSKEQSYGGPAFLSRQSGLAPENLGEYLRQARLTRR